MFKLDLEKADKPEIKQVKSVGSKKNQESSKKNLLLYWLCQSLWLCGSQQTVENSLNRWEYQTTLPASWEICMQVQKQQLELDMEQILVPNKERSTSRLYIVTLLI